MKFDQDLCLNLKYDFGKMNSTLGSVVPLAMFIPKSAHGGGGPPVKELFLKETVFLACLRGR